MSIDFRLSLIRHTLRNLLNALLEKQITDIRQDVSARIGAKDMSKEGAIVPRSPFRMLGQMSKASEKVVFLNDKNLAVLKGYKAYVQVNRQGEIHITITGLSKQCSKSFFDNLEALNAAEVISGKE
jgi:hypothetical protein